MICAPTTGAKVKYDPIAQGLPLRYRVVPTGLASCVVFTGHQYLQHEKAKDYPSLWKPLAKLPCVVGIWRKVASHTLELTNLSRAHDKARWLTTESSGPTLFCLVNKHAVYLRQPEIIRSRHRLPSWYGAWCASYASASPH